MGFEKPIRINQIVEEQEKPSRTYALDMDKGRIMGMIDGLEAVEQSIRKTLATPQHKCLIYDNRCGCAIRDMLAADDVTPEYIESEIPRLVENALLADSRILEIVDFEFEHIDDTVCIKFGVNTVFGTTGMEVVV